MRESCGSCGKRSRYRPGVCGGGWCCLLWNQRGRLASTKRRTSHSKPVTIKVKSYANCTYVNNKTIFFGSCDFSFVCLIMLFWFVCVGFGTQKASSLILHVLTQLCSNDMCSSLKYAVPKKMHTHSFIPCTNDAHTCTPAVLQMLPDVICSSLPLGGLVSVSHRELGMTTASIPAIQMWFRSRSGFVLMRVG